MATNDQVKSIMIQAYKYVQGDDLQLPQPEDFSGRMLEENVETALSLGLSAGQILSHVSDALANEARKKKCYPSELQDVYTFEDRNIEGEVADLWLQLKMLTSMLEISETRVDELISDKLEIILQNAKEGKLKLSKSLLFYRIKSDGNN